MVHVNCDGSIIGNPGGHGYTGWVVRDHDGQVLYKRSDDLGVHPKMSNNVAEYGAVLAALNWLVREGMTDQEVEIRTDSQLIVRQLCDVYQCHQEHLRRLREACWMQAKKFPKVTYIWIPREQNGEADELSKSLHRKAK